MSTDFNIQKKRNMKKFTELELKSFWLAVKQGATTLQLMEAFDCSMSQATELYVMAQQMEERQKAKIKLNKKRRQKELKRKDDYHQTYFKPDEKKIFIRPKAVYDNESREEKISKLLCC